ncbi:MAG: SCP2 sterol-binding domain-containing protein, partial [Chloroflexi bacterium]|nr:SCP2 sterol-binding domain-containing protein [Chloroflexota bacterium]
AIHDFDIRSAFDANARLEPECVPALLDMTPRWLGMCFRPSEKLPKPVVYGFDVEGENSQLVVTGDAFEMKPEAAPEADLSLSATGEQYLLFTYGRLTAEDGIHLGRLSVTGEISHLDQFEVWFKGL